MSTKNVIKIKTGFERESKPLRGFIKFLFSFFFALILFFTVHSSVYAATYYVATTGSDSNTTVQAQNPATPWLTLDNAEFKSADGDTVNVSAGTYVEDGIFGTHGWISQKAITWNATGVVIVKGTGAGVAALRTGTSKSASFNGFTLDAEGTRSNAAYLEDGAANKMFNNVTFVGATQDLVNSSGTATNITITNSTLTSSVATYMIYGKYTNLQVTYSTFTVGGATVAFQSPVGVSSITFDHNTFNLNSATSVIFTFIGTLTVTFTNNTLTGSITTYLFFLYSNGSSYNFSGNTITLDTSAFYTVIRLLDGGGSAGTFNLTNNNNITVTSTTNSPVINANGGVWAVNITGNTFSAQSLSQLQPVIGIDNQVSPIVSNNTIETLTTLAASQIMITSTAGVAGGVLQVTSNTLRSRNPTGYVIAIGTEGTTANDNKLDGGLIEGNTIYGALYYDPTLVGVTTHAIFYGFNKNATVRYNKVYGDGYGVVIKANGMTYTSGGVYYNQFINSATAGIIVKGIQNATLYNNTIYTNSSISGFDAGINIKSNGVGEVSAGTVSKNNIIYSLSGRLVYVEDAASGVGFVSDNNLYYSWGGSNIGMISESVVAGNFAAWQAAGFDTHGVYADPLFINIGTSDYRLQRTSPAIDIGVGLGFSRDLVNTSVPQGSLPDAGAYEYVPLTVTINQAVGQSDPTNSTINFTVTFSESVSDFATDDVTFSGTAGATTGTVTGSGTTYNVAVTEMTGSGTIIATLTAGVATGATSNTNAASTSADNIVTYDITAPTGGSITYTNGYQTTTTVALTVSDGTDSSSGINTSSRIVQSQSATLTDGTCGSYGSWGTITTTGTYPDFTDSTVISGNCYKYQYLVSDNVGNQATYTSSNVVKVDTSLPSAPGTPSVTTPTNSSTQTWVWTAATDAVSGIANYLWRTTGSAITSGSTTTNDVVTSLVEGIYNFFVKAVDNAGNQGSETSVSSLTVDKTVPSNPSLSSPTGYTKDNTKPTLIFKKSTDSGSGISSYSISLDSGKNRSFSTSGIPATGNGTSNYVWKDDSSVKIEFFNENDSDSTNDEIHVYFKDLNNRELTEGKHSWKVTVTDKAGNETTSSQDFYLDKTNPSISELAIANVSTVSSGTSYNLDITNRIPSFSGLATDNYQGSTVANSNDTKDTFDKVSSSPQTLTLTFKKQKSDQTYADYSTENYSLTDIQDQSGDKKSVRFYITTPFPLVDGYYQVSITLKDGAGNPYSQPAFYISLDSNTVSLTQKLFDNNLETKITDQKTVPAITKEEKQQIKENGYTVKVKVVDSQNKPVSGAKVTIHSKVQETTTDKNGLAVFNGVESGEHKILIAYSNYSGEQKVNLTGEVKEFDLNIKVKQTNAFLNPQVMVFAGLMGLVITILIIMLIKAKKKV